MKTYNPLLDTDSYKASHWLQYPPGTTKVFSYIESRGGDYNETLFFGLQMYLKEYLSKPITLKMINEAKKFWEAHGEPFNYYGWLYILKEHKGYMPLKIKAAPEGMVIPISNVLVTVENTDPKCFWLTSFIETALLRAVWYPTTVATVSWNIKQVIRNALEKSADNWEDGLSFKLHDFGARGVSSKESAGIGGAAHLVNFMGTDTVEGVLNVMEYYNTDNMPGFSIPAAEHSTITCWGKDNEIEAYRNMIKQFGKKGSVLAVVSDSYDIYYAVERIWGEALKKDVLDSNATIVIRPDSGIPHEVVLNVVSLLGEKFGFSTNSKGYKLLNKNVRVIQGDGINQKSIEKILDVLLSNGWSADNVGFGMGGGMLQHMDRDTQQWAMKACAMKIDGDWVDVWKDPVTDKGKRSKKGLLTLAWTQKDGYRTIHPDHLYGTKEILDTVYENGTIMQEYTFESIRVLADISRK